MPQRFAPDAVSLLDKAAAGHLHKLQRPPRRQHLTASKPSTASVLSTINIAHSTVSKAAAELESLLQQSSTSDLASLPEELLDQVNSIMQLALRMPECGSAAKRNALLETTQSSSSSREALPLATLPVGFSSCDRLAAIWNM